MTVKDVVLHVVALRLAALLVASLLLQALSTRPPVAARAATVGLAARSESTVRVVAPTRDNTKELLREMLLHD